VLRAQSALKARRESDGSGRTRSTGFARANGLERTARREEAKPTKRLAQAINILGEKQNLRIKKM
jgi:hypothetical protein